MHEDVYDTLLEKLADRSADVIVGDPADPATGMGPMSSEAHFNKVLGYIDSAIGEGAHVVCGGKQAKVDGCEGGFFVQPTALANDTDYGLAAGVWTQDLVTAQQIAADLNAGSVWINDWHMMRTDAPFGGFRQSGQGREFGKYSIDSYVETKSVSMAFESSPAALSMRPRR